ncbi:MAG: AIR synthase related protein [Candidatus Thorarchaeota archaeon]
MPKIETAHGAGGKIMQRLLEDVIIPAFRRRKLRTIGLDEMDDGATLQAARANLIVCTDAHTIHPIMFPGGDLGILSACGTINDLAVMGAQPVAMTNTVIVEERVEISVLESILKSLNSVIEPLGVAMIAGKVLSGKARVVMRTTIGGRKIIQVSYGEPIPRVC